MNLGCLFVITILSHNVSFPFLLALGDGWSQPPDDIYIMAWNDNEGNISLSKDKNMQNVVYRKF